MKKIYTLEKIFIAKNYTYAFHGISFDPEDRGKTFAAYAQATMKDLFNKIVALDPEKKIEIEDQFDNIIDKYKVKIDDLAGAKSKVYSSMITGPANFPVAKNEKRMDAAMKRSNDLWDWVEKVENNLIKKYTKEIPLKEKIKKEINSYLEMKKECKGWSNTLLKGRLTTIAKHGGATEVKEAIADYKIFTKRNGFHKILDDMIAAAAAPVPTEADNKEFVISESIKVVDDLEANRIRIYFDYKPDAEVRTYLKSKAFKWSPKAGAWQNYRRPDRLIDTIEYLKNL